MGEVDLEDFIPYGAFLCVTQGESEQPSTRQTHGMLASSNLFFTILRQPFKCPRQLTDQVLRLDVLNFSLASKPLEDSY